MPNKPHSMQHPLLQCPYCNRYDGGHGKKVPHTIGHFKIRALYNGTVHIYQCVKCLKPFRLTTVGSMLMWADMSSEERKSHNLPEWVKEGIKNDKKER